MTKINLITALKGIIDEHRRNRINRELIIKCVKCNEGKGHSAIRQLETGERTRAPTVLSLINFEVHV